MRSHLGALLFVVLFILSFSSCVQGNCLDDQRALLVRLNQSLIYSSYSSKFSSWRLNTDCCSSWDGITCDKAGHVISLDLSNEGMTGGLNKSSSLFKLQYLVRLNLAFNSFEDLLIPSGFDQLTNLKYLNLSYSGFTGQIPIEISRMTRLVTLDLSKGNVFFPLKLTDPDLETLTRNLTELRELLLDGIDLSGQANKWCRTLSSFLPKLQVLSLYDCGVSGPFDSSLSKLRSLSVLHLSRNNISAEVPQFFSKFHNLTSLHLSLDLYGEFPHGVFQLQKLQSLDLSSNYRLQGSLPEFPKDGLLHELVLSYTNFTGELPDSIGNLRFLSRLELGNCRFNGSIPTSFSTLNQLEYLDLSHNGFTGTLFNSSEKITYIDLSYNRLTGPIMFEWNKLPKLAHLDLTNNLLNGTIPMDLLTLPSLDSLDLSMNQFTGQLGEFFNGSLVTTLDLSNNQLQGLIPESIFGMSSLRTLKLSSNNFSGTTNSNSLANLFILHLSGNQFTEIPIFLKYQSILNDLDLSNNQIHGKIPNWIWMIGNPNGGLSNLNLSQNFLEDPDQPWPADSFDSMRFLDLHSNRLQGNNPIAPSHASFLDYSFNNFTVMIPNISSYLSVTSVFYFSNNQLSGDISTWVCTARSFIVLDLSYNNFSGPIPSCLASSSQSLRVLNLRGNDFQGNIPETLFPEFCGLNSVDFSRNKLEGLLPRSIVNCMNLEVLNVGNNRLNGTFPSWLSSMPQLHVLLLRSNNFYGVWESHGAQCNFSMLQIIDISSNNFSGILPKDCFSSWNAMIVNKEEREWNHMYEILLLDDVRYHQPKVTVTSKGIDIELMKIVTIFTSIDFSNNKFEGGIPEIIGSLTSLFSLDFSDNGFTGKVPPTFGNLTHLESLDLSRNKLTGKIPFQLAGLSFLSFLNLSFNKLVGEIPSGGQFQTFQPSSFQGNAGLCGFPLLKDCNGTVKSSPNGSYSKDESASASKDEFDWVLFAVTFLGFVVGAGMVIGPQYFWKKGREWANNCINKILRIP